MELSLEQALQRLKRDTFCLWIGAGVSIQLGGVESCPRLTWKNIVEKLESAAGIKCPDFETDYPTRIEVCLRHLKRPKFQSLLREEILGYLAKAIVEGQKVHKARLPEQARQLAHLGTKANPIVNFNIESLTSQAIAAPGGPWRVLPFNSGHGHGGQRKSEHQGRFERHIYHPHGVIDLTGLCVIAASEYHSLQDTLALQLAVHLAFGLNLAIVGMSLEDVYLRDQLEMFRNQINQVFLFTDSEPSKEIARWAWKNAVTVVKSPWDEFWKMTVKEFPGPEELNLLTSWLMLLMSACGSSGTPTADAIQGFLEMGAKIEDLDEWLTSAKLRGEKVELRPNWGTTPMMSDAIKEFFGTVARLQLERRKTT